MRINKYCPTITHLFYADDSLLFFKAADKDCRIIKNLLMTYEEASGQTVNYEKSMFMVSPNTTTESKNIIKDILQVPFTRVWGNI